MPVKQKKVKGKSMVKIDGEILIYQASEVCETLKKYLSESESMEIDLQDVSEIDTSGIQLLLALKKQAKEAGKDVSISMHSEKVVEVIEMLNIAHELGDPIVLSSGQSH